MPAAHDEIDAVTLAARLQAGTVRLVDVREPAEWQVSAIPGAELMPLASLPGRVAALRGGGDIVLYCRVGGRSRQALDYLAGEGLANLYNLTGGIRAWRDAIAPEMPVA